MYKQRPGVMETPLYRVESDSSYYYREQSSLCVFIVKSCRKKLKRGLLNVKPSFFLLIKKGLYARSHNLFYRQNVQKRF